MALFKMNDDNVFAALDIGSYGLRCAVFEKRGAFPPPLLAYTEIRTQAVDEARVTDFQALALSLGSLLEEAEKLCQSSFSEVWLAWNPPLHSFLSRGMAVLPSREVTAKERDLALETACAVPLPEGHVLLHSRPESFQVDACPEVSDPLFLSGLRLETQVRLFSAPQIYRRDINRVLRALACSPRAFFHNLVAYGEQLSAQEQKQDGVCLLDIGYKSSRGIVYIKGKTEAVFSLDQGGANFTQAVSERLGIPLDEADQLKREQGDLFCDSDEDQALSTGASSYISRRLFSKTLEKTAETFLEQLRKELESKNLKDRLNAGLILTGQTAKLPGFVDMASFYLGCPVSLPVALYENFQQDCISALPRQAGFENRLSLKPGRKNLSSPWTALRELF